MSLNHKRLLRIKYSPLLKQISCFLEYQITILQVHSTTFLDNSNIFTNLIITTFICYIPSK